MDGMEGFVTTPSDECDVLVLGAGLAGLAAAGRLHAAGLDVKVFERAARSGGLLASRRRDGFTFDHGPHVSFTRREEIRDLLAGAVGGRFEDRTARLLNSWRGVWLPHPAQCHLYGLPVDLVERCLVDFIERPTITAPKDYAEWCLASLGRSFSEEFTFRYTRKYWTAEPRDLTVDWVGQRVHAPSLAEVVRGALSRQAANQHYISRYRYPTAGGFDPYLVAVASDQPITLGQEAVHWEPEARRVHFRSGRVVAYRTLVSSLPLPALVAMCASAPPDVRAAAARLRCSSIVLVNVAVDRADGFPDADWMYFYDDDVAFARGYFPHRLAAANAPQGQGSIQVEVYHSPYRALPTGNISALVLEGLHRTGVLTPRDRVLFAEEVEVPFANVIFDHPRRESLGKVGAWLDAHQVVRCGRFGEWEYFWTDDTILSGWRAAERVGSLRAEGRQ